MKIKLLTLCFLFMTSFSFSQKNEKLLYKTDAFCLYANRVEQGKYKAIATSPYKINSDYQSPANTLFNPVLQFKFSINGKDNETPMGENHLALIQSKANQTITIKTKFGERTKASIQTDDLQPVPENTKVRFELDFHPVLDAFQKDGYYTDILGNKIYKSDFKGIWIAGGSEPLSWDFENLPSRNHLKLEDFDGDGIYTIEFIFNPSGNDTPILAEREIKTNLTKYPKFESNFDLLNIMHNLSLEEMVQDIRTDNCFMAGEKWDGVWTRDISYSIVLSLAIFEPEIAKNSLMRKVKNKRIIQDTGTGGSWPCSTDRQTWALAAWEVYKTTGDLEWLKTAFEIIQNSITDDLRTVVNKETGLFYGESSFLDWRKQTYPVWMEPVDIYMSQNLGTNAVFYQTLSILADMASILNKEMNYKDLANNLKKSINKYLWCTEKNYYGQYLYGKNYFSLSPRSEALGEALCLLFGIADKEKAEKILANVPIMKFGIPTIYPQIQGIPPYHNQSNWPFVQAYWTWAGAREKNTAIVEHGLASVYRQAAMFLTNKENMVIENGDFKGTEINSSRQLWSVAGNLATIYRVLLGMNYYADKIVFTPFIPISYEGKIILKNFKYRNASFDIELNGFGNELAIFELDGKISKNFISASLTGHHSIKITMNSKMNDGSCNLAENSVSPDYPDLKLDGNSLTWNSIPNSISYKLYKNGIFYKETNKLSVRVNDSETGEFQVSAISNLNIESFLSKPVQILPEKDYIMLEAEEFSKVSTENSSGYSGKGFVEFSSIQNKIFKFEVNLPKDGEYFLEFRYANGSGPVNSDNKCGIRSLYLENKYLGVLVFPQRGTDEWSNWGISNSLKMKLKKGSNKLEIRFDDWNNNMNGEVNRFFLDQIQLKIKN